LHWSRAEHPDNKGKLLNPEPVVMPENLSAPDWANVLAISSWSQAMMCIAKCSLSVNAFKHLADLLRLQSTSGGSMDTELKLLTVIPAGPLSVDVVTTVTPVAKFPKTSLNPKSSTQL
jgi:hypothetical protein